MTSEQQLALTETRSLLIEALLQLRIGQPHEAETTLQVALRMIARAMQKD